MVVAQVSHQLRADDARYAPGGQHGAVDAGQALCTESIGYKRGQGAKAAAVAQQDVAHHHTKNPGVLHLPQEQERTALADQRDALGSVDPLEARQFLRQNDVVLCHTLSRLSAIAGQLYPSRTTDATHHVNRRDATD